MSRPTLRTSWINAVASAPIGNAAKALGLYLATRMTGRGYVEPISREQLADLFDVHQQRIAERFGELQRAGYLVKLEDSGVRGRKARYVATFPPERVPLSGTHSGPDCIRVSGTHSNALRTAERYTQRARVLEETRKRDDDERNDRVSPVAVLTERRQRREAERGSPLAAILRKLDGRRPSCTGLRVAS